MIVNAAFQSKGSHSKLWATHSIWGWATQFNQFGGNPHFDSAQDDDLKIGVQSSRRGR